MRLRSKSALFLMEQLIVIAVFAICAVACISILATSFIMASRSKAVLHAIIEAQNYAETFKATGGDTAATADMLGGENLTALSAGGDFALTVYYDSDWRQTGSEADADFLLTLSGSVSPAPGGEFFDGNVIVRRTTGEELVNLPIAVRG